MSKDIFVLWLGKLTDFTLYFFREDMHFATTIMLVLTCLLCLYTLFQSSLSDVPKTAYLKYIDYWNLFALAVSFINFTILVLWEIGNYKLQGKLWTTIKSIMRIAMPLITFFGVTYYWIMAGKISETIWKTLWILKSHLFLYFFIHFSFKKIWQTKLIYVLPDITSIPSRSCELTSFILDNCHLNLTKK